MGQVAFGVGEFRQFGEVFHAGDLAQGEFHIGEGGCVRAHFAAFRLIGAVLTTARRGS